MKAVEILKFYNVLTLSIIFYKDTSTSKFPHQNKCYVLNLTKLTMKASSKQNKKKKKITMKAVKISKSCKVLTLSIIFYKDMSTFKFPHHKYQIYMDPVVILSIYYLSTTI